MDAKRESTVSGDMTPLLNFMSSFFGNAPQSHCNGPESSVAATERCCPATKRCCPARGGPEKKRYFTANGRQLYTADEKVDAVVRIQTMGYTKAEVARDLKVAESTLRGWFKNRKIADEAEAVYRRLMTDWSTDECSQRSPDRRRGVAGVEPVENRRRGRHKQPRPRKLRTVPDGGRETDFGSLPGNRSAGTHAVVDNKTITVSDPSPRPFAVTSNGWSSAADCSRDVPFGDRFASEYRLAAGSPEPQPLDLSTRSRYL